MKKRSGRAGDGSASVALKPIETVFVGHRFRSRLEARWAVFFKTLGIPYDYEKEGYDLDGVWYLPDFWLPEQQCFFEVKGQLATEEEYEKAKRLAQASGFSVYLAMREITPWQLKSEPNATVIDGYRRKRDIHFDTGAPHILKARPDEVVLVDCCWCECPYCGWFDLAYGYTVEDLPCGCFKKRWEQNPLLDGLKDGFGPISIRDDFVVAGWFYLRASGLAYTGDSPRLKRAYTAARQARFEHGDRGM